MEHIPVNDLASEQKLKGIINTKQKIEHDMATSLLNVFNRNSALIGVLRALVANAVEDIDWIIKCKGEAAYKKAFQKDAVNYGFVQKYFGTGNTDYLKTCWKEFFAYIKDESNIFSLNATACSNLIRFYGEVIEAGAGSGPDSTALQNMLKLLETRMKGYQVGPSQAWDKKQERGRVSASPNRLEFGDFREKDDDLKQRQQLISDFNARKSETERRLANLKGGISLWVQTPKDLTAKMDKAFGLAHGATISGTTTDTVFFLNRMSLVDRYLGVDVSYSKPIPGWLKNLYNPAVGPAKSGHGTLSVAKCNVVIDPVFYLVPFATIVSKGHHTTLEVALPLVLNGIIKYNIGSYSTLFPDRGQRKAVEGTVIKGVLREFDTRAAKNKILVYYDKPNKYGGYITFKEKDAGVWDKVAQAGKELMNTFSTFNEFPTKKQIASLHPMINRLLYSEGYKTAVKGTKSVKNIWEKRIQDGGRKTV